VAGQEGWWAESNTCFAQNVGVLTNHLMRLLAQEYLTEFTHHESFKLEKIYFSLFPVVPC
jgi:hypothetical protein